MTIWYKNIVDFFDIHNLLHFYPTSEMNFSEKLNSVLRLSGYLSIIIYSLKNDYRSSFIFIMTAFVTFIMFVLDENKEKYVNENRKHDMYDDSYESDEIEYDKKNCTKPTRENPFMNVMMNEYEENPKRHKACEPTIIVNKYIDEYFDEDLYRTTDDIYNKNASERQYYTMPSTEIPNDQDKFANWLYGINEKTCKEGNGLKCKYFS
jgi:hypothetical protein